MTTPAEARWKELVAQLAARVGLTPLDVEAATEGRVKADEAQDLMSRNAEREQCAPPAADGAPPVEPPSAEARE
jgi:hypothetical protein